jgi:hypothetical protein
VTLSNPARAPYARISSKPCIDGGGGQGIKLLGKQLSTNPDKENKKRPKQKKGQKTKRNLAPEQRKCFQMAEGQIIYCVLLT